jgi:hypothetical protein
MGDEGVAAAGRARPAHRHHREPPTEERMPGVSDLDLDYIPGRWVLERGINRRPRSTISIMTF